MTQYKILYKPKGKAAEYCEGYALNLYDGCEHGCTYCYAPLVRKKKREEFHTNVKPYKNVLPRLQQDLDTMVADDDIQEVFLSFTSDPFQPCERKYRTTMQAIAMLENHHIPYRILTKAGPAQIPFLKYLDRDLCTIGSTLVFFKDSESMRYEPGAALTSKRIEMLETANYLGFKTWVSLEPVWTPDDALSLIECTCAFVDEYKIGKLNYHPQAQNVDWPVFAREITDYCNNLGVKYVLKEDLRKLL